MKPRIGGVIPAVITPFDQAGHVSEPSLRRLTDFMIDKGVDCLFVCGTDGEGMKMTSEQRKRTAEIVVDQARGRVPVIAHVGSACLETSVELAKHAESIGADALAAVQPYFYAVDEEGLIEHYKRICSSTHLPFLVYNNPVRTGNKISLDTMKKLAKLPNVIGCKDTSGDIRFTLSLCRDLKDFVVIVGEEALIYSAYFFHDFSGAISGIASCCPEPYVAAFKVFREGDPKEIRKWQFKLISLEDLFDQVGYTAALKESLRLRDICDPGPMIPPFHSMSESNKEILREGLTSFGLKGFEGR